MSGRVPLAVVVSLLEVAPSPAALARARELDRQAELAEAEGRRSIATRAGSERAWQARAAKARAAALAVLQEGDAHE